MTREYEPPFRDYFRALNDLDEADRWQISTLLDLDQFHANAADLRRRADGLPLRVASKSLRVRSALTAALDEPGFSGVFAYTLDEALWLLSHGVTNILVGYPTANVDALRRWATDPAAREHITVTVDSVETLEPILAVSGDSDSDSDHHALRVCVEVDVSWQPLPGIHLGPARSPVRTPEHAAALARGVLSHWQLRLVGLLAYEGQIAATPDHGFLTAPVVRAVKNASIRELTARRQRMVAAVRAVCRQHGGAGLDLEFVNAGGTGSVESTTRDPSVTEISVGSGLMGPSLFEHFAAFRPRSALHFIRPVVRRADQHTVVVQAGGWIASGRAGADRVPSVVAPSGLTYLGLEGAGEVQTPLRGAAARQLRIGDPVFFRHAKAGELAEHVNSVAVYSQQQIIDVWPTYRGESKAFT